MIARVPLPSDPLERRRLWREWIHLDTPALEQIQKPPLSRIDPAEPQQAESDWLPEVIDAPSGIIHGLKRAIAECLIGGILPIADRERLIRRSMKLGLNRFEANLLIAAVQNRAQSNLPRVGRPARVQRRWRLTTLVLICLAVESMALIIIAQNLIGK